MYNSILVNFPNAMLNAKRLYSHLKFLVDCKNTNSAIALILISIVPLNNMPSKTSLSSIAVDKN